MSGQIGLSAHQIVEKENLSALDYATHQSRHMVVRIALEHLWKNEIVIYLLVQVLTYIFVA